jgi:hypothetical protein
MKYFLILFFILISKSSFSEEWSEGYYVETESQKKCSAYVKNQYDDYLSFNFTKTKDTRRMNIQLLPKEIKKLNLKGDLRVEMIFKIYNNNKIIMSYYKTTRMSLVKKALIIDNTNSRLRDFKKLIKDFEKHTDISIIVYDEIGVTYDYIFSLESFKKSMEKATNLCY